jgi:hypothetical protein
MSEEALGQLRLAAVLAASDLAALGDVLCHRAGGLVFLLQALVAAPALVQVLCWPACALECVLPNWRVLLRATTSHELNLLLHRRQLWPKN